MPLSFPLGINSYFLQWWLHFRFALACCLIHIDPRSLNPFPPPRSWLNHGLLLMYWLLQVPLCPIQHPSPKCLVCHMFCTALCVCHVHSVDASLLPCLPFSHLHCLYLQPGFALFPTLLSLQEDRNAAEFVKLRAPNRHCTEHWMPASVVKCWPASLILDSMAILRGHRRWRSSHQVNCC